MAYSSSPSYGGYPAAENGGGGRYPPAAEVPYPHADVYPTMPKRAGVPGPSLPMNAGGAVKEQEDKYILYGLPNHKPSQKAHQLASLCDKVKIQNINDLQRNRLPPWLNGAPILYNEKDGQIYKGIMAIRQLEAITQQQLMPYDNGSQRIGFDNGSNQASANLRGSTSMAIDPYLDDASLYPEQNNKVTENDIQLLMQKRNSQNQRFAAKGQAV